MLENIIIKQTESTPLITLNEVSNELFFTGILIPDNSVDFFRPLIIWINKYQDEAKAGFKFVIELEHFNTPSSILLLKVMKRINKIPNQKIIWFVDSEDEDMIEVVDQYDELMGGGVIDLRLKKAKISD
tara:strand:+ start:392 stop:778 length:387 start_codon:yes stop_codon:yes gene_type:complete